MATNITDWGGDFWLGVLFGLNSAPGTYYIALLTGAPDQGFDGTVLADLEPTDTAYAREAVAAGSTNWTAPEGWFLTNKTEVTFATPVTDWGVISHYALCTAATAGEIYAYGEFSQPQEITTSSAAVIPVGGIVLAINGPTDPVDD